MASEVLQETPASGRAPERNALHLASANGAMPRENIELYRKYANLLAFYVASALVKMQPPTSDTFGLSSFSHPRNTRVQPLPIGLTVYLLSHNRSFF